MQVEANGIGMRYRIDGPADAPWLIFGDSLATDLSMWDAQPVYFVPQYRALRCPQRDHGQTEAPATYSFDILIADTVPLMDALGIARAHVLLRPADGRRNRHGPGRARRSALSRWFPPETVATLPPHLMKICRMIMSAPVKGFIGCAAMLAHYDFSHSRAHGRQAAAICRGQKRRLPWRRPCGRWNWNSPVRGSSRVLAPVTSPTSRPDMFNRADEKFLRT